MTDVTKVERAARSLQGKTRLPYERLYQLVTAAYSTTDDVATLRTRRELVDSVLYGDPFWALAELIWPSVDADELNDHDLVVLEALVMLLLNCVDNAGASRRIDMDEHLGAWPSYRAAASVILWTEENASENEVHIWAATLEAVNELDPEGVLAGIVNGPRHGVADAISTSEVDETWIVCFAALSCDRLFAEMDLHKPFWPVEAN
jgi:hypothetical protein